MRYGIILFGLLLAGCGQKGALYMPHDKPDTSASAVIKPASSINSDVNTGKTVE